MNRLDWPCSSPHLKARASELESTAVGDSWLTSAAEEAPRDDMSAARRAQQRARRCRAARERRLLRWAPRSRLVLRRSHSHSFTAAPAAPTAQELW